MARLGYNGAQGNSARAISWDAAGVHAQIVSSI